MVLMGLVAIAQGEGSLVRRCRVTSYIPSGVYTGPATMWRRRIGRLRATREAAAAEKTHVADGGAVAVIVLKILAVVILLLLAGLRFLTSRKGKSHALEGLTP